MNVDQAYLLYQHLLNVHENMGVIGHLLYNSETVMFLGSRSFALFLDLITEQETE